jgi:hypothetical protein
MIWSIIDDTDSDNPVTITINVDVGTAETDPIGVDDINAVLGLLQARGVLGTNLVDCSQQADAIAWTPDPTPPSA